MSEVRKSSEERKCVSPRTAVGTKGSARGAKRAVGRGKTVAHKTRRSQKKHKKKENEKFEILVTFQNDHILSSNSSCTVHLLDYNSYCPFLLLNNRP